MKEAILNAMNPIEKKILEKEVQKIHIPEEPIPFDDFGKKIRYVKKIRELLDQDAELKEIKLLFGRKGLHQGWYYKNETPLASYVYWYGRGCGREDVCRWAVEASTTIDGLLQVQESSHLEKIAKKFISMDKYYLSARIKIMPFRFEGFICGMNCAGPMRPIICLL